MMKLIITWKNKNVANFEENRRKVEDEFKSRDLTCLRITKQKTEVLGTGEEKDFSRIWISISHLEEHNFFYDAIESCIWYDDEPLEDIIIECKKLILRGKINVYD